MRYPFESDEPAGEDPSVFDPYADVPKPIQEPGPEPDFGEPTDDEGGGRQAIPKPPPTVKVTGQNAKGTVPLLNAGKGIGGTLGQPDAQQGQPDKTPGMPEFFLESGQKLEGRRLANGQIDYHTPETPQQAFARMQEQMIQALPPALQGQFRLQQLQLSQVEQLELQKARNGLAAIDANPYLTDELKAQAKMLYQTKINPLALRQAQSQALQTQLKNQEMRQQQQIVQQNLQAAQEFFAQNTEKRISSHAGIPGMDGHQSFTQTDKNGLIHPVPGLPGSKEFIAEQARRDKIQEVAQLAQDKRQADIDKKELDHKKHDEDMWDKRIDAADKYAEAKLGNVSKETKTLFAQPGNQGVKQEWMDHWKQEYLAKHDTDADLATHLKNRAERRRKEGEIGTVDKPTTATQQQPAKGPPAASGDKEAILGKVQTDQQATGRGAVERQRGNDRQALIDRMAGLDNAQKWATAHGDKEAADVAERMRNIIRVFPNPADVPPKLAAELQAGYQRIKKWHDMH